MNPRMNKQFSYPKIGIRPTIDGRLGGVRESLEQQTMDMANRLARLYADRLCQPDGSPVECVIADSTIGGVREAAACEEKFQQSGVGLSVTVTPCWCYGSETMDMDPYRPKAVWGFNGTERPGAVYLAAVLAGHTQKGIPAFGIYGEDVQEAGDESIPADVEGNCSILPVPDWRWPSCGAKLTCRWGALRWGLPARWWTAPFGRNHWVCGWKQSI